MKRFTIFVLGITIVLVALMRLQLAVTRAFDPDEFAYLHWTWLIVNGFAPYRDFFFYILPGFLWFLAPLLAVTGDSVNFLITSRILMCIMYGLCAWMVYQMTKKITDTIPALLATLVFLTFPVTIDKTIDIRPDMVMLLLYFGSIMVKNSFPAGILFGASFLMFPKIIFGLPALLFLLFSHKKRMLPWLAGASLVALSFLGYLAINNLIPQAITSITKDALAVTNGKGGFSPLLLLSPYPLIYLTQGDVSLPWSVNTGVWILGIAGLFLLLKHHRHHGTFWGLFIAGNILFVILFPVPYVQYLLPLSIAASVLSALAAYSAGTYIVLFVNRFHTNHESGIRNHGELQVQNRYQRLIPYSIFLIPVILLSSFFLQYRERVPPGAGNAEQLLVISDVLKITKPNESVYDMVGSYVFRPDGYYICCHPYAEFGQLLASRPGLERELRNSLIARQTKFLVMDRVGFVFWKSLDADKAFLLTNYLPMGNPARPASPQSKLYSLGQSFRCQQGACVQFDLDGKPAATRSTNTFTIVAAETYMVSVEPKHAGITIDDKEMRNDMTIELTAGIHRFLTHTVTTEFKIQLRRD